MRKLTNQLVATLKKGFIVPNVLKGNLMLSLEWINRYSTQLKTRKYTLSV